MGDADPRPLPLTRQSLDVEVRESGRRVDGRDPMAVVGVVVLVLVLVVQRQVDPTANPKKSLDS
jgi:hypothetical protein